MATSKISPPYDELRSLSQPLTDGEWVFLEWLIKNLTSDWEIYVQPYMNGLRPDFVLLSAEKGIAVYEVKDWDLSKIQYRYEGVPPKLSDSHDDHHRAVSIGAMADSLWDVDEADRLAKLAMHFPELLTHEEQLVWKLVKENGALWKGFYDQYSDEWTWYVRPDSLTYARLREHWATFNSVARGEADRSTLPKWVKTKPQIGIDDLYP